MLLGCSVEIVINYEDHLVRKECKWGSRVTCVWCGFNISLLLYFSLLVRSAFSATGDSYSALLTSVPVAEVRKLREAMREATHDQGHF